MVANVPRFTHIAVSCRALSAHFQILPHCLPHHLFAADVAARAVRCAVALRHLLKLPPPWPNGRASWACVYSSERAFEGLTGYLRFLHRRSPTGRGLVRVVGWWSRRSVVPMLNTERAPQTYEGVVNGPRSSLPAGSSETDAIMSASSKWCIAGARARRSLPARPGGFASGTAAATS